MHATNEVIPVGESEALTVLVAEDEVLLRMLISDHLRSSGFNVLECANGQEARKVMDAVGHVDVVISDVHMTSQLEGVELATWLGQHYPTIPVILTSGSASVQSNAVWKTLSNVTDFVPKPYAVERMEMLARTRGSAQDASPK